MPSSARNGPSSSRRTILCCRGTTRESGRAATRWFDPAPQSAWSLDRRRSETAQVNSGNQRCFLGAADVSVADPIDTAWFPNKVVKWHPGPCLQIAGTLANCIREANNEALVKRLISRRLSMLEWEDSSGQCATRCTL